MKNKIVSFLTALFMIAPIAIAEEVAKDIGFDGKKGEVSYTLMRPALVRISLGVEDGPIFATLTDWRLRKKGSHKEVWAKISLTEINNLLCNEKTFFTFNYISYGREEGGLDLRGLLEEEVLIGPIGRSSSSTNLNRLHKRHNRQFCREPRVNIILPDGLAKREDGVPIIDKPVFLTIELDSKDRQWFTRERYSLYMFVDTVFSHGCVEGFSPYHWQFDPAGLNEGIHLIIVNLRGFQDHLACAVVPVYAKAKG